MAGVDVAELLAAVLADQSLDGLPVTGETFLAQECPELFLSQRLGDGSGSFFHSLGCRCLGFLGLGVGRVGVAHSFGHGLQTVGQGANVLNDIQQEFDFTHRQQIAKVEDFFRVEIKTLMRKTQFIDDIKIDDDFNIFLYRHEPISCSILLDALEEKDEVHLAEAIGHEAVQELYQIVGSTSLEAVMLYCASGKVDQIILPIRVDQTALSNGEKQIFIMALYHSLVQLGRHEIPFIIDTPFARIDTEHRRNISTHFFSKLHGQVFILSTNEEINSDHVQIMKERIAATYTLENSDNKRTIVVQNAYFEV